MSSVRTSPFAALRRSRKFLLLVLDTVVSVAALLIGQFIAPEAGELILSLVALIQPVFIAIIIGIAVEDAASKILDGSVEE